MPPAASIRPPILVSAVLSAASFAHGFSTREGGVSAPPYDSLDFSLLRDASALAENQKRLASTVGFDPARLFQCRQVHGRALVVADAEPPHFLDREADALVAEPATQAAVSVRVADCVPVLLADPKTGRVAAAHAGWRGVVLGVLHETVAHMTRAAAEASAVEGAASESAASRFLAAIGPCIGPCCFEVSAEVAERIANASTPSCVVARRSSADGEKAFVDLRLAVRAQLLALGLAESAIDDVPDTTRAACTRCNADRFYSYRRDGDASGRLIGVIVARG